MQHGRACVRAAALTVGPPAASTYTVHTGRAIALSARHQGKEMSVEGVRVLAVSPHGRSSLRLPNGRSSF